MSSKNEGLFLEDVIKHLKKFASTSLAEGWDNVGLLVEPSGPHKVKKILLTNDLTQSVMRESVDKSVDMIISYHPPIFKPLKRLCQGNWKERLITQSIENRIAIYSPHTCFDAVKGGVNDWLLLCFGDGKVCPITPSFHSEISPDKPGSCYKISIKYYSHEDDFTQLRQSLEQSKNIINIDVTLQFQDRCMLHIYVLPVETVLAEVCSIIQQDSMAANKTIEVVKLDKLPLSGYGMGRIIQLNTRITIEDVINKVKQHLGIPHLRLAIARKASLQKKVERIAVCAGSGGSLLNGVNADVYVTGEMSHHDVLHATESGRTVLLCEHTNTERGYLKTLTSLMTDWFEGQVIVETSEEDRDPLVVV
eukprot:gene14312-15801_t